MNTHLIYPNDVKFTEHTVLSHESGFNTEQKITSIDDLNNISSKDRLIYLIPSSFVKTKQFGSIKNVSYENNLANFISEVDTSLANDVSENEFYIFDDIGFIVKKDIIDRICSLLSRLKCNIVVIPDYFLIKQKLDTVSEFNKKLLFSFEDGSGNSIHTANFEDYVDIIKNQKPNYEPIIFGSNETLNSFFKENSANESIDFIKFISQDFKDLPNLFKFKINFQNIINKINLTKIEMALSIISIAVLCFLPFLLIKENYNQANDYQEATFEIFKSIDKNTKRVVSPRLQIDQIINQIPEIDKDFDSNKNDIKKINFLIKLGDKYLESFELDNSTKILDISIRNMPEIQFKIFETFLDKSQVTIVNKNIARSNDMVTGEIKISI